MSRVIQISVDIEIDEAEEKYHEYVPIDEEVRSVLENAGYSVANVDCTTSWSAEQYWCGLCK